MCKWSIACMYRLLCSRIISTYRLCTKDVYISGIIFFCYLTDFSYFSVKKKFLKIVGQIQNRSKMTFWKGGVDGFSYFTLIFNYFIFLPESSVKYIYHSIIISTLMGVI